MTQGHTSCHKTKPASLLSGCEINAYLLSLGSGYSRDSSVGISTKANAFDYDKVFFWVCANLKKYIDDSKKTRKRKSARLDPQAMKIIVSMIQIVSP